MPFDKTDLIKRWRALSPREQMLLIAGLAAALPAAVYGLAYEPMRAENQRLQQQIEARQQIRLHLQEVAQRVAQVRQAGDQTAAS
ncbi:type II secretion system protein GspM, partial [Methylomonas rivi]